MPLVSCLVYIFCLSRLLTPVTSAFYRSIPKTFPSCVSRLVRRVDPFNALLVFFSEIENAHNDADSYNVHLLIKL